MTEQGKVIKIEKNEAVVRVQRKSACASCGMCAMKPKDSHIDVRVENALEAKEGDLVQIKLESGSVAKISLLVYILLRFAVGFIIVFLLDKKIAKSKKLQPVLLAVIPDGETEQEINKNETITET